MSPSFGLTAATDRPAGAGHAWPGEQNTSKSLLLGAFSLFVLPAPYSTEGVVTAKLGHLVHPALLGLPVDPCARAL
jgi:hypothetical protein